MFYQLDVTPGISFDEAWAANFSYRIFSESGFWPYAAMNSYTSAWPHYLVAFFYNLFGVSFWTYRFTGLVLTALGLLIWMWIFYKEKKPLHVSYLPLLFFVFPGLYFNHRFFVEVTSFYFLCTAVFFLGVWLFKNNLKWSVFFIFISCFFGMTSHVLFITLPLSFLITLFFLNKPIQSSVKLIVFSLTVFMLPLSVKVFLSVPEKGKALALIIILMSLVFIVTFWNKLQKVLLDLRRILFKLILIVSIPFFLYMVLFLEGTYSYLWKSGEDFSFIIGILWVYIFIYGSYWIYKNKQKLFQNESLLFFAIFVLICSLITGNLWLKPQVRYTEINMILIAFGGLYFISEKYLIRILPFVFIQWCILFYLSFFKPYGLKENTFNGWGIVKDNSKDFMSEKYLSDWLGSEGCGLERAVSSDSRIMESLTFLSIGDWPVDKSKTCPYRYVLIERKSEFYIKNPGSIPSKKIGDYFIISLNKD